MVNNKTIPSREAIIDDIITIYIEVIGFFDDHEKERIDENTNMAKDFKVDSDDLSLSIAEIFKHFSVSPTQLALDNVKTIGDMADLIIAHGGYSDTPYTTYKPESAWPGWIV